MTHWRLFGIFGINKTKNECVPQLKPPTRPCDVHMSVHQRFLSSLSFESSVSSNRKRVIHQCVGVKGKILAYDNIKKSIACNLQVWSYRRERRAVRFGFMGRYATRHIHVSAQLTHLHTRNGCMYDVGCRILDIGYRI